MGLLRLADQLRRRGWPSHRLLIFLAMAAMLVTAVALSQAFGARAPVFGLAFLRSD